MSEKGKASDARELLAPGSRVRIGGIAGPMGGTTDGDAMLREAGPRRSDSMQRYCLDAKSIRPTWIVMRPADSIRREECIRNGDIAD